MKFVLAFVGTMCLMGAIHAQMSNVATTVANAVSTSTANLASTLASVTDSVIAADQTILDAFNTFGQSMIALYNSYVTKYQDYTSMDLSQITNAITNLQSYMSNVPQRMQDDTYQVQQTFTDAQMYAQQIQDALQNAVMTMTASCGTNCATARAINCANKFGNQLNSTVVTIDRVAKCIAPEAARFSQIATDVSSQYATTLAMASNYLLLDSMCDIPSPAVLNNPSPTMGSVSNQCFTNYLSRFSNMPMYFYSADQTRYTQLQMIAYRAKRCSKLVALDVQDRINQIVTKYTACL